MTRTIKASLLLFFFSLCASAVLVTHHLRSHLPPPAPHDLFRVVAKQLAAFRVSDYSSAYRQAASGVKQKFTAPQFESMIRHDYVDMTTAQRVEFGFAQTKGSSALLQVFFFHESGSVRSFIYNLIAEGNVWKINGVQRMESAPPGHHLAGLHI